ncbi:MAG TPA: hypothetical protein PLS49_02795 [Candidatus Woesebacteria bacterium]|nr:hypothetical protein [Candidatus Woesebacteria bacterium]
MNNEPLPSDLPQEQVFNYDLIPLNDIPMQVIAKGDQLPGYYFMMDDDSQFFEQGDAIELNIESTFYELKQLLQDPDIASEFLGIDKWLQEVDLEYLQSEIKKYNDQLQSSDVTPSEQFLRQSYALNKTLNLFYRESSIKDPDSFLQKAVDTIKSKFILDGKVAQTVDQTIAELQQNPLIILNPGRFDEHTPLLKEVDMPPVQLKTKRVFQTPDGVRKLESITQMRDKLDSFYSKSRRYEEEETARLMECILGRILGRNDYKKLIESCRLL